MEEDCNELKNDWFTATVLVLPDQPIGFIEWTEDITQYKYHIILPDNSTVDARIFMDANKVFDNGSYTQYLNNRFLELK